MEVEMEDKTTQPEHLCGQCHLPRVPLDLFIEEKSSSIPTYRDIGTSKKTSPIPVYSYQTDSSFKISP